MTGAVDVVFDREFQGDLWAMSRRAHVWIIASDRNATAARIVWERESDSGDHHRGVTIFTESGDASDRLLDLLPTIVEHHPDWSVIRVLGLRAAPTFREEIADVFDSDSVALQIHEDGFKIRRVLRRADPDHSPG